jgi:hypothetical protein
MILRIILSFIIALSGVFVVCHAQQGQGPKESISINSNNPTVYLTFEKEGPREPIHPSESKQGIWLRLHNNSKWAINFCTLSLYVPPKVAPRRLADGRAVLGLNDGVEINVCHGVEHIATYQWKLSRRQKSRNRPATTEEQQVGYDRGDVFSSAWLPPGSSVVFSVPREHLSKELVIFLRFNYEWEYGDRAVKSNEPEHRVYFRAADLPQQTR